MKVILINCFGGILRTNKVVATLENAIRHKNITKPIVIRLKGNSASESIGMMNDWKKNDAGNKFNSYPIYYTSDMDEAAQLAVKLARCW